MLSMIDFRMKNEKKKQKKLKAKKITKSKISMMQRRDFLLFLLFFSKKASRSLFFRNIKYARTKNGILYKLNNGIFGISKARINTKPFPRVSVGESIIKPGLVIQRHFPAEAGLNCNL